MEFSKLRKPPTWASKIVSHLSIIGEEGTNEPSHSNSSPPSSCLQMHPIPESSEAEADRKRVRTSHSSSLPNAYSGPQADNSLKLFSGQQKASTSDYASPGSTLQRGSGSINSSKFASFSYSSRPGVASRRSWGPGNEELYLYESDSTLVSPCRKCAQAQAERIRRQRLASEESNKSAPIASVESLTSIDTESSARGSLDIPDEKAKNRLSTHSEGYCYFVFHDMDETEIFPSPKPGSSFVTNAVIESDKRLSWDDSKDISPTLHLKRPESTQLVDRYGNVKGRTTVKDRYTLTYDNGRNSPYTSESQETTPKHKRELLWVLLLSERRASE